jgi:Flp pilus assembly protein TadG
MRRAKNLVSDEGASELVEFALVAMIFFTLMFGIMEFCLAAYAGSFVAFAAQQGTRYAMVRGSDWNSSCTSSSSYDCQLTTDNVSARVQNYILGLPHPGLNLTASNINVTPANTTASGGVCTQFSRGCQIKVTVSYTFHLIIPFFSASIPLSSTSEETIQD